MIQFDLPKDQSSILKVIGIGGGGSNAVNYMFGQNIDGVDFIICNTDSQALDHSGVPNKIQLGPELTQGLGAGANPEIGKEATEESLEEIKRILEVNTKMAFITAGMGGGTGTGGAPIVAKVCQDLGILTVGIVTTPFKYEGRKRMAQAQIGLEELKKNVDTLLVISNDKLRHQFGNLTVKAAFSKADNILATAAKCITDVINSTGQINVDFADVCTVMRNGGVAILGSAVCEGENRAQNAIEQALNSPLLNDNDISGAKWILININSAEGEYEFTMDEVDIIQSYLLSKAGEESDVILGLGYDNGLDNGIGVTLIATGFADDESKKQRDEEAAEKEEKKEILELKPMDKKTEERPIFVIKAPDHPEDNQIEKDSEMPATGIQESKIKEALDTENSVPDGADMEPRLSVEETPVEKPKESIVYFDLMALEEEPNVTLDLNSKGRDREDGEKTVYFLPDKPVSVNQEKSIQKTANIYVEKPRAQAKLSNEIKGERSKPDKTNENNGSDEMRLIEKDPEDPENGKEKKSAELSLPVEGEVPASSDNIEELELKRKAMDRLAKLRNLSFNKSTTDPNDDYESVPAYLRRNLELHNSIANVESFYSNYSVKSDDKDNIQISSLNSYLNGKRPD